MTQENESSQLDPQAQRNVAVANSIVFISASSKDYGWRDRLKVKLDSSADQIEWWDDSRIEPGVNWEIEIQASIERANVAVVLLSRAYLASNTATSELILLGQQAESRGLKLFPILLEECPWNQFAFLRRVQVWSGAKPIGNLSGEAADSELERIAQSIRDVAASDREAQGRSSIRESHPRSDGERENDPTRREFHFSTSARAVLDRAWSLAEQSGRAGVTSSCLLFTMGDPSLSQSNATVRFLRTRLNRGRYEAALDSFLKDSSGDSSGQSASNAEGLPWKFSLNMRAVFKRAEEIAMRVMNRSREIHTRHLFAALLLTSGVDRASMARKRLTNLGLDLATLIPEFRVHLRLYAASDNPREWDSILGISEPRTAEDDKTPPGGPGDGEATTNDGAPKPTDGTPTPSDSNAVGYQQNYSAFVPDRAAYGRRNADELLDDSLGVRVYAGHLAQLIAAKETFMPLSIGLFGAWGAGKSHFIDLLDEELRGMTREPRQVFHQQIVQIRFNAWHYLDTNLWANLVSEIFDQLFAKLDERKDTTTEQVDNLKKKLAEQSALAAEALAALETARNARKKAEEDLRLAIQARAKEEENVGTLLDDLGKLVTDPEIKKQLHAVADGLGLPKVESSFAELEARAEEVRSLGGRAKALMIAVFSGPGWWRRGILLAAALMAPLLVAWLAEHGTAGIRDLFAGAGRSIAQFVVAISALATWLASQAKAGNAIVGKLESAYDKVKKVRADREATDEATLAQKALAEKRQAENESRHTLHEAEEKMKTISAELAEMAPGRQLIRFLKQRASAEDYRRHLGLISLVRRDFEQLSNLLVETTDAEKDQLPKIDRIVLYIDDLDRCRADKVIEVLEAVHLLLAFPLFAVVVAVDPRWLRQSLLDHYPRLLGGAADDGANDLTRTVARPATPQDYLEKIFQVPFNLQTMEKPGFEELVKHLFPFESTSSHDLQASSKDKGAQPDHSTPESSRQQVHESTEAKTSADATEQSAASEPRETIKETKKQTPPDPKRLTLTKKEVEDVKRFQLLFQTPRAVKRLANTYSLIRVSVGEDDWDDYLGPNESAGAYRVPLLLLAVASGFPALARPWLLWLRETMPTSWQFDEARVKLLTEKYRDTTNRADWEQLAQCFDQLNLQDWPLPEPELLAKWVPRVARYSF